MFSLAASFANQRDSSNPFSDVRNRSSDTVANDFTDMLLMGVQEGLRSCLYHLQRFQSIDTQVKQLAGQIASDLPPKVPQTISVPTPSLVTEYEAFTLVSRATLDRLCHFLGFYFRLKARNLYRLARALEQLRGDGRAEAVVLAIEKHRGYLDTQIASDPEGRFNTDRDLIAHKEYSSWTVLNLIFMHDASVRIVTLEKSASSLENVEARAVLEKRFECLGSTVKDIVAAFLLPPQAPTPQ